MYNGSVAVPALKGRNAVIFKIREAQTCALFDMGNKVQFLIIMFILRDYSLKRQNSTEKLKISEGRK